MSHNLSENSQNPVDSLLDRLRRGQIDIADARGQLQELFAESLGFATLDHHRQHRCGYGEVVFAAGKTPEQLIAITEALLQRQSAVLITRLDTSHRHALTQHFSNTPIDLGDRGTTALIGRPEPRADNPIPVVTAGTSDQAVAEEAVFTCRALGHPASPIYDVGVAGLHRLTARLADLRSANVIICIAGMEGALPSVLGGLVDVPVIAVPTSVGYGASLGGLAALLGMLNSCASGVTVVNIDNGFGAAYNACLINRLAHRRCE